MAKKRFSTHPSTARCKKHHGIIMRRAFVMEALPNGFSLGATVCSYGFSMLAPNVWRPGHGGSEGELERPLRCSDGRAVVAIVRQPSAKRLEIFTDSDRLSAADVNVLRQQVVRMLRLQPRDDIAARKFSRECARDLGKGRKAGRLFRSPSFFEDLVKTFTLCNCGWGRTISMNDALCKHVGNGAFPSAFELAQWSSRRLLAKCGVGYRAERMVRLARLIVKGKLNMDDIDNVAGGAEEAKTRCSSIFGLGPFGVANALQLLGHYNYIPADSETVRHLRQARGLRSCSLDNVSEVAARVYQKYAPWQFLRYWTELWRTYEERMGGRAYKVDPQKYRLLTASQMDVRRQHYSLPTKSRNTCVQKSTQRKAKANGPVINARLSLARTSTKRQRAATSSREKKLKQLKTAL